MTYFKHLIAISALFLPALLYEYSFTVLSNTHSNYICVVIYFSLMFIYYYYLAEYFLKQILKQIGNDTVIPKKVIIFIIGIGNCLLISSIAWVELNSSELDDEAKRNFEKSFLTIFISMLTPFLFGSFKIINNKVKN